MSEEIQEKIDLILNKFENFTNFIELDSLRSFLLFTLNGTVPSNILAQMGLGGGKDTISLPFNPLAKIYYQKVSLMTSNSLVVYVKSEAITEKFIIEKDDPLIKKYLNENEKSLAFRGKEKFILPKITDCSTINGKNSLLKIKIDDLFYSLESFLAVTEPNILFVLDAQEDSEPDIIVAFNMMPEIPAAFGDQNYLKIDAFLDYEHNTRGITYIKRKEDYEIEYLEEIKDISHSEIFKSKFALILHMKSFNAPY